VSHFLIAAFLGVGPWQGAGFHLLNGGLAALLGVDLITRLLRLRSGAAGSGFSQAVAAFLLSALILLAVHGPSFYVASPGLDFPAFVIVAASSMYLADWCSAHAVTIDSVVGLTLAATVVTTRLQFLPAFVTATAMVMWVMRRRTEKLGRLVGCLLAIPMVTVALFAMRTFVLSGYPMFPSTVGGLGVDWKVPRGEADELASWIKSWARAPGQEPSDVLGNWAWFRPWLDRLQRHHFVDALVDTLVRTALLTLLAGLVVLIVRSMRFEVTGVRGRDRNEWMPWAFLIVPNLVTLAVWFVTAPDPRFALAPIALISVAAALLADLALTGWTRTYPVTWALGALLTITVMTSHDLGWIHSPGDGPFGTGGAVDVPTATTTTSSGLRVLVPTRSDQCWSAMPCSPDPPTDLMLRGTEISDGFRRP
jgi:hypothetical protein